MLNVGSSFLFGIDGACVSAAVRMHCADNRVRWQLPLAFGICDGLGSFLGCLLHAKQAVYRDADLAIAFGTYGMLVGVLLVVAKWPGATEAAGFRRALMLMVIPVLLATDNFFGARTLHGVWNPATFAETTGLISTVMSLCGLILGDALRVRSGAFARSVLMSAILLALAGLVG
jgi:hypothetical protein